MVWLSTCPTLPNTPPDSHKRPASAPISPPSTITPRSTTLDGRLETRASHCLSVFTGELNHSGVSWVMRNGFRPSTVSPLPGVCVRAARSARTAPSAASSTTTATPSGTSRPAHPSALPGGWRAPCALALGRPWWVG